jgi:hypothetical protein
VGSAITSGEAPGRPPGLRRIFRRKGRFDPQPTERAAVLLASPGDPFSRQAIRETLRLRDGEPVAVVTIARLYGSAYGLPNPGLMPTRAELTTQEVQVARATRALERRGAPCSGQVAISRRPARTIARVAAARGVTHVVMDAPERPRWRRVVEGDPVKELQRRLGSAVEVHAVRSGPSDT